MYGDNSHVVFTVRILIVNSVWNVKLMIPRTKTTPEGRCVEQMNLKFTRLSYIKRIWLNDEETLMTPFLNLQGLQDLLFAGGYLKKKICKRCCCCSSGVCAFIKYQAIRIIAMWRLSSCNNKMSIKFLVINLEKLNVQQHKEHTHLKVIAWT